MRTVVQPNLVPCDKRRILITDDEASVRNIFRMILAAGFPAQMLRDGILYPDSVAEVQPIYPSGGKIVWQWHDPQRAGSIHGVIVLDALDIQRLNSDTSSVLGPLPPAGR